MSIFQLPTVASPSDTGVGSIRNDEYAPSGAINPNGSGTVAFEFQSPANSYWVPRLSYINVRLKVTKSAALSPLEEADGGIVDFATSVVAGAVQFRTNPVSTLVNTFRISSTVSRLRLFHQWLKPRRS